MTKDILRPSPFVFLKNLIIIELLFALIPLLLLLLNVDRSYEASDFARIAPFTLLWTLFVTVLQIIAVSAAFLAWHLPRYVLDVDGVYFQRGPGRALTPIFLKENNAEKFYVRAGNASQPLTFSQAVRYIQARFPQR